MMLTSQDYQIARKAQESLMGDRVAIERAGREQDATGGVGETFTLAYDDVPARIAPLAGGGLGIASDQLFGSRRMEETEFLMSVAHDLDLDQRDRVRFKGEQYEIIGIVATSTYLTAQRVLLRRIR